MDTNIFITYVMEPQELPDRIFDILDNRKNQSFVSAIVPWEISIKHAKGHLPAGATLLPNYEFFLSKLYLKELAVVGKHGVHAGQLPTFHRDPFDRLIIAQAMLESLTILTLDNFFHTYGVSVIQD